MGEVRNKKNLHQRGEETTLYAVGVPVVRRGGPAFPSSAGFVSSAGFAASAASVGAVARRGVTGVSGAIHHHIRSLHGARRVTASTELWADVHRSSSAVSRSPDGASHRYVAKNIDVLIMAFI